jgi:hypothetical protein
VGVGGGATLQSRATSDFRFQISYFRFQIPTPGREADFSSGDFRFQISDPRGHKGRNIERKQNSERAEHISRLHHRFLRDPYFRFQIPKLARFLISDFKLRISDPRTPGTPRQRFQISENRFQRSRARSHRFQISDFRSLIGAGHCDISTADVRMQNSDTRHQEISLRGP